MNLCYNAVPEDYLPVVSNKSANDLILNNLGGGIANQINRGTYFHTTCSDATQGHLTDSLCPVGKIHLIHFSM